MAIAPIFILSHARTGSTLLRYVVNAHPDVCSPAELMLGRLCRDLTYTLAITRQVVDGEESAPLSPDVFSLVRLHVDQIMTDYCARRRKTRWCEKSVDNIEHLDILGGVFPDAQYICLHRNCLDVVHSLLEKFRYGFASRFSQLVARRPENTVAVMVESWVEATQAIVDLETSVPDRCLRVAYEQFVAQPVGSAERLFGFLGLPFDARMLDDVFTAPRDRGPGDLKIQFTRRIHKDRVGLGASIPRQRIPTHLLARVNTLHERLGYPPIGEELSVIEKAIAARAAAPKPPGAFTWNPRALKSE